MRMPIADRPLLALLFALAAVPALARQGEPPYSLANLAKVGTNVPIEDVGAIDARARRSEIDRATRAMAGQVHTKRLAIADGRRTSIAPERQGRWDTLDDGSRLWRVRVRAAGATDLHLGFSHFAIPEGATLYVIGADRYYQGPYDAEDARDGIYSLPVVPGDTATLELHLPVGMTLPPGAIELDNVGAGFQSLFDGKSGYTGPGASGTCNVNVVCPLGADYPDEIRAVGHYQFRADDDGKYYICTGTLLADLPRTQRPWFLTAAHCLTSATEAASIVVYWNYQSSTCNTLTPPAGGYLNDNQSGATLRAALDAADVTLLELNAVPKASSRVYYAGWDATRSGANRTIGLHHPSGDVKKITLGPATFPMDRCITGAEPPRRTFWHAGPYDQGTTEGGSSGSGLFVAVGNGDSRDRRLIGTLSGGTAGCSELTPTLPDSGYDCYAGLWAAWDGDQASTRLRDWLDPNGTDVRTSAGADATAPSYGAQVRTAASALGTQQRSTSTPPTSPLPFDTSTRRNIP